MHCHPSTDPTWSSFVHSDALSSPKSKYPIAALKDLAKRENLKCDLLLCPGDLCNRMNQQGFVSAWQYLRDISQALDCELVAATLGNHDVASHENDSPDIFDVPRRLHDEFPIAVQELNTKFWADGFCVLEHTLVTLLVINSVKKHSSKEAAKRGEVAIETLENIKLSLSKLTTQVPRIAVCHHHPIVHEELGLGTLDIMINGSELIRTLGEAEFTLLIHGHKHRPRLTSNSDFGRNLFVFGAGSLGAVTTGPMTSHTRNLFHIVDYQHNCPVVNGPAGTIHSWEWAQSMGWVEPCYRSAGFPKTTGFGFVEPVRTSAAKLLDWFNQQGHAFVDWQTVIEAFPYLLYVSPQYFLGLQRELESLHALQFQPPPPDPPVILGRLK